MSGIGSKYGSYNGDQSMNKWIKAMSIVGVLLGTTLVPYGYQGIDDCLQDDPFGIAVDFICQNANQCGQNSECTIIGSPCVDGCDSVEMERHCLGHGTQTICQMKHLGSDSTCRRLYGCGQRYSGVCQSIPGSSLTMCTLDQAIPGEYCNRIYCLDGET